MRGNNGCLYIPYIETKMKDGHNLPGGWFVVAIFLWALSAWQCYAAGYP